MIFLLFCSLFLFLDGISFEIYLFLYDAVLFVICVGYLKKENLEFLEQTLNAALVSFISYLSARYIRGTVGSWNLTGRTIRFYVLAVCAGAITGILMWKLSGYRKEKANVDEKDEPLFKSRKHDLARVETYLKEVDIVGINGAWGTGKSFLMDSFCKTHKRDYEFVRLDLLTCSLDEVDLFLLQEMETILKKDRIYPKYSKQLHNIMSEHSWMKEMRYLLQMDNDVKSKVFDEFRRDMKKLGKPVVLIIEDLDRVEDSKVVRKILDLTERLSCAWIKAVIEYDAQNLTEMGFDRNYIEKYIPYVVNLMEIPFDKLLKELLEQRSAEKKQDVLSQFFYLIHDVYQEEYSKKLFGIPIRLAWERKNVSARKVKTFLRELEIALQNPEFQDEHSSKTAITFFMMKHFYPEIYEKLPFEAAFIAELCFVCPWEKEWEGYSILELFALRRWNEEKKARDEGRNGETDKKCRCPKDRSEVKENGLTVEQMECMFWGNGEVQIQNRQKLCILYSMGYHIRIFDEEIQKEQEIENSKGGSKGAKRLEHSQEMGRERMEQVDWNEKVSRLIFNLHTNGKSELTDNEKNAEDFIREVLGAEKNRRQEAWHQFTQKAFHDRYDKDDNGSIFVWGGDWLVELAQAVYLFLQKRPDNRAKEAVWLEFIEFCYEQKAGEHGISPEYICWCNYIRADKKLVFLEVIRRFCAMEVVGNLNREKSYLKFLRNYYMYGCVLGYFRDYDIWQLDFPEWNEEMVSYVKDFLERHKKQIEEEVRDKVFGDTATGELQIVCEFLKKNIEILDAKPYARKKKMSVKSNMQTKWDYVDESVYRELERIAKSGISRAEYQKKLDEAYKKGKISLAEMRRLLLAFSD